MESHVAVRLTNFIDGQTGRGTVHNLTQSREEFTRTRNKTKQQLINEWVSKQIVFKYLQGEKFFCHFFHLFLIVEYANNFKIVIREGKRRIFEKYKNVVFESYGKEEDLMRSPTGFFKFTFQ